MDAVANPYAPGAGNDPPELAGRDRLIEQAAISLERLARGKAARSMILTGLRGVGKTVLLNTIRKNAESKHFACIRLEASDGRSLPSLLAPGLRSALLRLDRGIAVAGAVKRSLRALAGFVGKMRLTYSDVELKMDVEPEAGLADGDHLDDSLTQLLVAVGEAAREKGTVVVLFIDELHVVPPRELAALIMALHVASQDTLPVTMIAAGLPQIPARMGEAKTYAERLFEFPRIDSLDPDAARRAIVVPAQEQDVEFEEDAIAEILAQAQGYAYFLQEWGKHSWNIAEGPKILGTDVRDARQETLAALDESFFNVRFTQLTVNEKQYLRCMAELGPGPHRSGSIAKLMGKKVSAVAVVRDQLIAKGMLFSPNHGDTAFTVPLFDEFMKRVMPDLVQGATR